MIEFLIGFGIFGLAGLGLFLGAMFGRPPLKGSCGGNAVVTSRIGVHHLTGPGRSDRSGVCFEKKGLEEKIL